jgi:tetratricopeptide (TPR) repeat protein
MMRHPLIFGGFSGEIKNIMDKTPRPNRIREALGQLHEQQPPYFREYLRRFQEDPTSRVFAPLAEAYRRLGRFDEAISICLEGLDHHPDFHGGRVVLAKCYLGKGMLTEARGELERVVHAVPENLLGQRLLGEAYLGLGNRSAALHCYKMALLMAPNDVVLAEKVHELESGASVLMPHEPAVTLQALPESSEELEKEIPPLWASEFPAEPLESFQEGVLEPTLGGVDSIFGLQAITSDDENPIDDEAFKIEHVSHIFEEVTQTGSREITTETLGDLYFSQGQYDKALRIFEKLKPAAPIHRKIQACRARLGVDMSAMLRNRKIAVLRAVVKRARDSA